MREAVMSDTRLAAAKLPARIAFFGIHVAAFGAIYRTGSLSFGLSVMMAALSATCLLAEMVLSSHYAGLVGAPVPGLRLTHVLRLWCTFGIVFWGYLANSNLSKPPGS